MHQFSNTPPKDPRGESLPLVRCRVGKPMVGIILSEDLLGTATHFWRGRTIPCDRENCVPCSEGFPWRWHAYVGVYSPNVSKTCLFEMTARATEPLISYRETYGTLRGCHLTAKRANMSPNSRVILQTKQADLQGITLPPPPDIIKVLSIIWNIDLPSISEGPRQKNQPSLKVDQYVTNRNKQLSLSQNAHPSHPSHREPSSANGD